MARAVISLCDKTGNMVRPWAEAGHNCICIDVQHSIRRARVEQVGAGTITYQWGDVRTWVPDVRPLILFALSSTEEKHLNQ